VSTMNDPSGTRERRYAILTEGMLATSSGKTAHGVLRYRGESVVAVIDSKFAGKRVSDVLPWLGSNVPIVGSFEEATAFQPNALLIGVATEGGRLPPVHRAAVLQAVDAGLEIVSGLHELLRDDPEIVSRAQRSGSRLWDVRVPPEGIPLFSGAAYRTAAKVVLAIGSDCAVGKMTAMLEVERAAKSEGASVEFVATGQTGILIAGKGIAVDRVISDFITGAAEQLVLQSNADVVLVEGQGGIFHPAYAPVTFGLLYGSAPDALVLCHRAGKTHIDGWDVELPELAELVAIHEGLVGRIKPARVVAIALDTSALDEHEARRAIEECARQTKLFVDDPVRSGGKAMWRAIEEGVRGTNKARAAARAR
jgi:D-glutamate N-acetyltransferase